MSQPVSARPQGAQARAVRETALSAAAVRMASGPAQSPTGRTTGGAGAPRSLGSWIGGRVRVVTVTVFVVVAAGPWVRGQKAIRTHTPTMETAPNMMNLR